MIKKSLVLLDLCSGDFIDAIIFEKFRFQNFFRPYEKEIRAFSNSSGL